MSLRIRSGIPIPARTTHSECGVAASKMQVGDCVDVRKSQAVNMCQALRKRYGNGSACMRRLTDDTWRVWRTK